MDRPFCFVTLFAAILLFAAAPVALAQSEPAALLEKHFEAINRGDAAGSLAMFADDAVFDVPLPGGLCAAAPCVGKATIQKEMESRVADKGHYTILKLYVSGNVTTVRFEFRSDTVKQAGVERITTWSISEMKGDKIAYVRGAILDRTDPQTARFIEWQRTQPPAR
jgi:ketosteroid isomerase-like protein